MYLIADAGGPLGRAIAEQLLGQGQLLRVLSADPDSAELWRGRGAEVVTGELGDSDAWGKALEGVTAVALLLPPYTTQSGALSGWHETAAALQAAVHSTESNPALVLLSALGAEAGEQAGWAGAFGALEEALRKLCPELTVLRAAPLMESWIPSLAMARHHGVLPAFLQGERAFPMVAARDVAAVASQALLEPAGGQQVFELHGPEPYGLNEVAAAVGEVLSKPAMPLPLPEEQWPQILADQGLDDASAALWCEYYRAANAGLLETSEEGRAEGYGITPLAGTTPLGDALFQGWKALRQAERAATDPERKVDETLL